MPIFHLLVNRNHYTDIIRKIFIRLITNSNGSDTIKCKKICLIDLAGYWFPP